MFVSIHIPKTAGTMLGYLFDYGSNRRILWDYDHSYRNTTLVDTLVEDNFDFIKKYFEFLHGHFYYKKYAEIAKTEKFLVCLRHPLHRLVSQFKHEVFNAIMGEENWKSDGLKTGRMDLVDFILADDNIRLAQVKHTEGRRIEDYDFVFINEFVEASFECFSKKFGFKRGDPDYPDMPVINSTRDKFLTSSEKSDMYFQLTELPASALQAAYDKIPEEVELYQKAVEHAKKQITIFK